MLHALNYSRDVSGAQRNPQPGPGSPPAIPGTMFVRATHTIARRLLCKHFRRRGCRLQLEHITRNGTDRPTPHRPRRWRRLAGPQPGLAAGHHRETTSRSSRESAQAMITRLRNTIQAENSRSLRGAHCACSALVRHRREHWRHRG